MALKSEPPAATGGGRVERAAKLSLNCYSSINRPKFTTGNNSLPNCNALPGNEKTPSGVSPVLGVSWGNTTLTQTAGNYKQGSDHPVSLGNTTIKVTPPPSNCGS